MIKISIWTWKINNFFKTQCVKKLIKELNWHNITKFALGKCFLQRFICSMENDWKIWYHKLRIKIMTKTSRLKCPVMMKRWDLSGRPDIFCVQDRKLLFREGFVSNQPKRIQDAKFGCTCKETFRKIKEQLSLS